MIDLFIALFTFYLIITVGFLIGRIFKQYSIRMGKFLSFILLFILSPPLILFAFLIPNQAVNPSVIINIVIFQIILVVSTQSIAYILILRKMSEAEDRRKGSILSLVAFPNAFLFPLPIVLSLFGYEYIIVLVIFSLTAMILRTTLLTYESIRLGKKTKQRFDSLKEMFTFPPTVTLIISIIFNQCGVKLTQEVFLIINDLLSMLTSIIGALLIGVLLVNFDFSKIHAFIVNTHFLVVLIIRVVFSFFLLLITAQFIKFPPETSETILIILLLLFTDPPAVTNIAYAEYFELDYEFSGFCVFMITLLAVIYVPLFILLGLIMF